MNHLKGIKTLGHLLILVILIAGMSCSVGKHHRKKACNCPKFGNHQMIRLPSAEIA
jgi:hypothetical protein